MITVTLQFKDQKELLTFFSETKHTLDIKIDAPSPKAPAPEAPAAAQQQPQSEAKPEGAPQQPPAAPKKPRGRPAAAQQQQQQDGVDPITEDHVRAELMKVNEAYGAKGLEEVAVIVSMFGVKYVKELKPEHYAGVVKAAREAVAAAPKKA